MSSWFTHHDLAAMRGWCYVAARLDQELYRRVPDTMGPGGKMLQLLKPLLSNNAELIDWFAHHDAVYDPQRIDNPKLHDFWAYQVVLALRGDWSRLEARCRIIADNPPKAKEEQKYLVDYQFYAALAHGDVENMQRALKELVSPRMLHRRSNDESGYTDDLISTPAVIYAKIAWWHGFRIVVDTPYLPAEWLPMDPLAHYDAHYEFLRQH